jgi:hypothetical protein
MQSSSSCPRNEPTKWAGPDWERAWQSALRRVNGMPAELITCTQIHESLTAIDEAFIHGDSKKFEEALIELLDHCAELVNRGHYQQWW